MARVFKLSKVFPEITVFDEIPAAVVRFEGFGNVVLSYDFMMTLDEYKTLVEEETN